jgi:hypothetical protein
MTTTAAPTCDAVVMSRGVLLNYAEDRERVSPVNFEAELQAWLQLNQLSVEGLEVDRPRI